MLGISQSGVSARLRGRVQFTAAELANLADWLGVHPGRFFEAIPASSETRAGPSWASVGITPAIDSVPKVVGR